MRLVGSTNQLCVVEKLSKIFTKNHIPFSAESQENLDWSSNEYGTITWTFWVHEEKDLAVAKLLFLEALETPIEQEEVEPKTIIDTSSPLSNTKSEPPILGTKLFLVLCIALFLLNSALGYVRTESRRQYADSPIQAALLFDYPKAFQENNTTLPLAFFPGIIPIIEYTHGNLKDAYEITKQLPEFEQIQHGQVWRLFSPAFLHHDIFHLLFNMFWLLILGRSLERQFGFSKFILFSLGAALCSNVAQYFATGSQFLGFSGIIAAYAGYIFAEVRKNSQSTLTALYEPSRFIFGLIIFFAILSFFEFGLIMLFQKSLPLSIANTAHLVGFLFGYIQGHIKHPISSK